MISVKRDLEGFFVFFFERTRPAASVRRFTSYTSTCNIAGEANRAVLRTRFFEAEALKVNEKPRL